MLELTRIFNELEHYGLDSIHYRRLIDDEADVERDIKGRRIAKHKVKVEIYYTKEGKPNGV